MQLIAKVGSSVDVVYKATGDTTGLTDVKMKIFDETHSPDPTNFPDVTMTEIGTTGIYWGSFTPDAAGPWAVKVDSVTKKGPAIQSVVVTNHDLDSLGTLITSLNNLSASQVQSIVDGAETNILSAINDLGNPAQLG